jgi:hypothetical protein
MEQAELTAANKRIRELENEVAILKRARGLLPKSHDPKCGTGHSHMAAAGLTVQLTWRPPFFDEPRRRRRQEMQPCKRFSLCSGDIAEATGGRLRQDRGRITGRQLGAQPVIRMSAAPVACLAVSSRPRKTPRAISTTAAAIVSDHASSPCPRT